MIKELILLTLLIGSSTLAIVVHPIKIGSREIWVPYDYPSIQAAINAADPNDIIRVKANVYCENVVVNKTVKLVGEDKETTIVDGCLFGNVITVSADNVKLS